MIEALETPEQGMQLVNRNRDGKAAKSPRAKKSDDTTEKALRSELERLRAKIAHMKANPPTDRAPHCGACFRRGWEATMGELEREDA